jgi:hypothetical protein
MAVYQRINKDGTKVWRAIIRMKGYPTVCDHFERKQEALDWSYETTRQIKLGKYSFGKQNQKKTIVDNHFPPDHMPVVVDFLIRVKKE